jgi:HD-like signal output (HDOD) protein
MAPSIPPSQYPLQSNLDDLVLEIADLRPLPAIALRILNLVEQDRFSAQELATLITSDQVVTAKLLRLANSAYYGFARRIATVRDAVVLVGFRAVRSVALVSCVIDTVKTPSQLNGAEAWQFAVAVGVLAEILAEAEGVDQEQAFTAGVLHNIGLVALDQHRPGGLGEVLSEVRLNARSLQEAERMVFGFTDGELGGALAEHWGFPEPLVDAIRDHAMALHEPPDRGTLTACVLRARMLARAHGLGDGIDRAPDPADDLDWLVPPISTALGRSGGIPGVLRRADAFLEATIG